MLNYNPRLYNITEIRKEDMIMKIEKKRILKKVAEHFSISEDIAEREIKDAILTAKKNPTPLWKEMFGENSTPSVEEFCDKVRERVLLIH